MGAAPRIFEKAYGRVVDMSETRAAPKRKIFDRGLQASACEVHAPAGEPVRRCSPRSTDRRPARPSPRSGTGSVATAVLRLRRGCAQPRHRRVVPRRRHLDPRGLRPHRDVGRHLRQPALQLQVRHGRLCRSRTARSRSPRTGRCSSRAPASCTATTTRPEAHRAGMQDGWLPYR